MVPESVNSRWSEGPLQLGRTGGSLLACVYTCEANRGLLERFYSSEIGVLLRDTPGIRMVEVYADPSAPESRIEGSCMILRANESYLELPVKTLRMLESSLESFQFENLLKIDVTTMLTQAELATPAYSERKAMDVSAIARFLRQADYGRDYNGFLLHENAGREGAENWARKKGLTIDYRRLFGDGPMPPFYSGKCYILSRRFVEFVASLGDAVAATQVECLPGEDVMLGRMYDRFRTERLA